MFQLAETAKQQEQKKSDGYLYSSILCKAGQTILLQDGTYNVSQVVSIPYSVSGNQDAVITMKAENAGKAVLNGAKLPASSDAVLSVKGNYWKYRILRLHTHQTEQRVFMYPVITMLLNSVKCIEMVQQVFRLVTQAENQNAGGRQTIQF